MPIKDTAAYWRERITPASYYYMGSITCALMAELLTMIRTETYTIYYRECARHELLRRVFP